MDRMMTLRMVVSSIDFEPLPRDVCVDVVLRGYATEEGKEAMELVRGVLFAALDTGVAPTAMGGAWVDQGTVRHGEYKVGVL